MSYTSTDQGRMSAITIITMVRKLCILLAYVGFKYIGRGCGGKMFNMDGVIMSPMYPTLYNKSSTCRWDIAVPRPNRITIKFSGMYDNSF